MRNKENIIVSSEIKTILWDLANQIQYEFCEQYEDEIKKIKQENENLKSKIKFYIEQSDLKNMLWGKEILKIIGGNDD